VANEEEEVVLFLFRYYYYFYYYRHRRYEIRSTLYQFLCYECVSLVASLMV
jgi:hypothetical protein